jgi:hypothetical protein
LTTGRISVSTRFFALPGRWTHTKAPQFGGAKIGARAILNAIVVIGLAGT